MIIEKTVVLLRNRVFVTLFLMFVLIVSSMILMPITLKGLDGYCRRQNGIVKDVYLGEVNIGGYYLQEVEELLLKESSRLVRWPVPAKIDHSGVISQEIWGRMLDLTATMELIESAKEGERIEPVLSLIYPSLIAQEIMSLTYSMGVYYTYISGTEERLHNIKVAGSLINFTLIMPEEVFSFNSVVGEPSEYRGFLQAPIIVGEELVPGYGGGICQVSSTLYNAVLKTPLKVLERHSHSQEVSYVPPGRDATVAYDYLDFKFVNTFDHPILIRAWVWGRRLQVGVYGPPPIS